MSNTNQTSPKIAPLTDRISEFLIDNRVIAALLSVILTVVAGYGMQYLTFDADYKVFFKNNNPQLVAHEFIENTYTKQDNVLFIVAPKDKKIFTRANLSAIEQLTDKAWQLPYSTRVDSITNFQATKADGDDLNVRFLVEDALNLSDQQLQEAKSTALNEPSLVNFTVSNDGAVTLVNVQLEMPKPIDKPLLEAIAAAQALAASFNADYPNIDIYLNGIAYVNYSFNDISEKDSIRLLPIMFLIIIGMLLLLLYRAGANASGALNGTLCTMFIIIASVACALGITGWMGIALDTVSTSAPTIILTLAVADCVHILLNFLQARRQGLDKKEAMHESLSINLQPIFLTSLTTAIGFLSLHFSDSPPFHNLGTLAAIGIMAAFVLTISFLPAIIMMLPISVKQLPEDSSPPFISVLAEYILKFKNQFFIGVLVFSVISISFIPLNVISDTTSGYFDQSVPFRQSTDFMKNNLTGSEQITFSLDSGEEEGISDPNFLKEVDAFVLWLRQQPQVAHVSSYTDTIKRLNKSLNSDDDIFYKVPDNRQLASQYLLLYEMSLPFGLDLNTQINVDKSALRVVVTLTIDNAPEILAMDQRARQWLLDNSSNIKFTPGAGVSVMFANISKNNIDTMMVGNIVAVFLISIALIFALKSIRFGLLSLIPNAFPALIAFGLWGLFVGEVNLAVAVVFVITLGIVVDDSVHFISKYLRARRLKGHTPEQAIRYAFTTVGMALIITSVVLAAGFLVLAQSSFTVNATLGLMVAATVLIALVFDFAMLPALLIKADKEP